MKQTFEIEKGIPVPGQRSRYLFNEMEVGDSILVRQNGGGTNDLMAARAAASAYGRKHSMGFATRTITDPETQKDALRIWRLS